MECFTLKIDGYDISASVKLGNSQLLPLLVFNGIGSNQQMLRPFIESEALKDVEIITFDVPGTGGSPSSLLPIRFPRLAKLASHLLDRLGYEAVDVFGVSWGGALAQQFAKDYPQRCRRLILAATSPGCLSLPPKFSVLQKLLTLSKPSLGEKVCASLYGGAYAEEQKWFKTHFRLGMKPSRLGCLYQMIAVGCWTSLHWLHKLQQPTLVLYGKNDPLVPVQNAKLLAGLIGQSQLQAMQCGHMFILTLADQTAHSVRDFLSAAEA